MFKAADIADYSGYGILDPGVCGAGMQEVVK